MPGSEHAYLFINKKQFSTNKEIIKKITLEPPHDKTNKMACAPAKTQILPCPHEESFGP